MIGTLQYVERGSWDGGKGIGGFGGGGKKFVEQGEGVTKLRKSIGRKGTIAKKCRCLCSSPPYIKFPRGWGKCTSTLGLQISFLSLRKCKVWAHGWGGRKDGSTQGKEREDMREQ